jgi:hypothetical protein
MSKAKEVIELNEGMKTGDLYKVFKKVEVPSWNGFLADLQRAINDVTGKMITTEDLGKSFKKLI